ncbi:MAG: cell surface protein [Candidatus Methanoperedens nitroreducens]|uniref:Cell surface protein n=1 Tax=Candidatus Methanoperedens nitratireducens TaxID=1392998 RepID=A0A0P8E0P1_9EURY|nr:S8 family serine peptidase [Candidatus Methanoperedens sp. BLZ2]KAB2948343.1 MAG: S8 family serine peptidase [Candidatus Methanoperedens sp.]KPQ43748.1 MAG: cell surface protein [Candidatus Methanoperedens sp. BLZ1]MBZ0174574.1 S8 family serine peptidase [Candidatus Methanoperedens nitroreducens]MCX9078599.1 S8 family serine peptidase [Candidatus Methanoperedens sp.]
MTYLRNNNIRIGSIFLFCILAVVIINPSIAQESPVTLNSSHDPILRNISHIDSPAGWAKTAKIEKIDGGKTILVSTEINSLSLKLNDEKTKVNLTINDNRTDEFIVRMNNNKLNIYKNFMDEPAQAGLFSRNNNQSSRNRFDITSLKSEHRPGELLVKYTKKLPKKDFENFYKSQNITLIKDYPKIGYHLIRVDESRLENTIESLSRSNKFENTEPNYIVKALKTPNDPRFNKLWAMNNTGQTGGIPDADIDALQAWDISTGSKEVIVAVIDTGVDYTHEDLAGNMWTNPGEIQGNGIDDDNNGFVDDYYGWDFAYDDNNPMDVYFHGTHVSGTIGGAGNNGKGVAGVSWDVSIMAVKFIGDDGWGYTSDAIEAINYATMMGADIMSNSWGGGEYSSALEAAIRAADEAGILFVAAAGNWAKDTDQYPNYPSGYDVPNVISIAATDKNDHLADFSNYGVLTVDLGAPGVDILSSVPGNSYSLYSGTSMAAPHVSGAAALLKAFNPSLTHLGIKNILMKSVDPLPSLYGKTVTGGRLNVQKALTFALTYTTVCPIGCDYTSIQAAIDAANPGNTIIVRSGTYYENVNISKQLILRGFGSPVVDARGSGSAIKLSADGIILEGFTVTGGASYLEAGIKIISNNNTLSGNNANSNSLGIFLDSSNYNNITSNNISNSTSVGIKVYDTSTNNTISGNKVTNGNSGIFFVYAFNTTATNNIMENNLFNFGVGGNLRSHFEGNNIYTTNLADGRPVYYVKYAKNTIYGVSTKASTFYCILCNNVTIKDLEMSNMDKGVYFWGTNNSRLQNITVKQSGWGIFIRNSSNNSIRDSKLSTNNLQDYSERGVTIYSSDDNTLTNNTFILNNYGIELFSSTRNTIYNNYFNNTNNFLFSGSILKNTWNVTKNSETNIIGGPYLGGNFWANPSGNGFSQTCSDSNIDGLCDLKYSLNTTNADYLPLKYKSATGITVVSPNGGENWTRGTTKTIKWNSTGSPGAYVKIELLKPGKLNQLIISATLNDGSHPWLIPAAQAQGSDYKVRITSTANTAYNDTGDSNFTIPVPSFKVISPNGSESWTRGTIQTIRWNSTESPGTYVKIELLRPGKRNQLIIAATLNDGSHPWLIPPAQAPGSDYKVKITSTINASNNDTSDTNFTIPVPSFNVVSPNGGENWTRGAINIINWTSTENPKSYVKIELLKPGKLNQLIISATLNDGSHPWLIPAAQVPGADYKVKITSTINASNSDTSDTNFTIPIPSFTVVSPNGGENWTRGTIQTIKWNSTENPKGYVKIELLKSGILSRTIVWRTLNDGSQTWTIPATQASGADYKIRISSTSNPVYTNSSKSNFSISI